MSGRLSGVRHPGADVPRKQRIPPPTGKAAGQPLVQRDGPLPPLGVEVGPAQGAACRIRCDPLAALGAITGMHDSKDPAQPSEAAKRIVRGSEELPRAMGLDACRVRRHDSALQVVAQTQAVSEIARLRVSIACESAAVDRTLNGHTSTPDDDYPRWGWVEHKELCRQLGALHERVARAPSRSRDQRELHAEFATLLSFAKTLRSDAQTWRAALNHGLEELERKETAAREERERLAAEREALTQRRDALQSTIHETAGRIADKNGGDCRNTLPVFRLGEALTVCSVIVLSSRRRFRSPPHWLVTLNDSRDQVQVRRTC